VPTEGKNSRFDTFQLLQECNSQVSYVTGNDLQVQFTGSDVISEEVTWKWL